MIVVCDTFNPCDFLSYHFNTIASLDKLWCFKSCFLVISNRLWAHTKQKKECCVDARKSEILCIKEENHFH